MARRRRYIYVIATTREIRRTVEETGKIESSTLAIKVFALGRIENNQVTRIHNNTRDARKKRISALWDSESTKLVSFFFSISRYIFECHLYLHYYFKIKNDRMPKDSMSGESNILRLE